MTKYIQSPTKWVAEQVELYEKSGGIEGTTLRGLPVVIVTNIGWKTGILWRFFRVEAVSQIFWDLLKTCTGCESLEV